MKPIDQAPTPTATRTLYHATTHAAAILEHGLQVGHLPNFHDSRAGFIYVAERIEAEYYGGIMDGDYTLLAVDVTGLDLENDPQAAKPWITFRTRDAIPARRIALAV